MLGANVRLVEAIRMPATNANVRCPKCESGRVERFARTILYPDDPMRCGDCGLAFLAKDTATYQEWERDRNENH